MKLFVIALGVIFAWAIAYGLVDIFKIKQRWLACVLCLCAVIATAIGVGAMMRTPIDPSDVSEWNRQTAADYVPGISWERQKQITLNVFLVIIAPALIGAWMATTKSHSAAERDAVRSC